VFHGFGEAKFAHGGLILIYTAIPADSKNNAQFKSGQNQLKN